MAVALAGRSDIIGQIEQGGLIEVNVPAGLLPALQYDSVAPAAEHVQEATPSASRSRSGYRVLVFDDNNVRTAQSQAQARKQLIESRFPEFRSYVSFNSPYWRVKVGDFKTRSEAEAAMGAIRAAFPSIGTQLRVVRDKINSR